MKARVVRPRMAMNIFTMLAVGAQLTAIQDSPAGRDLVLCAPEHNGSVTALDALESIEHLRSEWFVVPLEIETILASHSLPGPGPLGSRRPGRQDGLSRQDRAAFNVRSRKNHSKHLS